MNQDPSSKCVLVTGCAGFIGYHLCLKLLNEGYRVIGLDNLNDYYSVQLKRDRLKELGIKNSEEIKYNKLYSSDVFEHFQFVKLDLADREELLNLFKTFSFSKVFNLAAQAGVRYSLENPFAYADSNIIGFLNLLESMRHHQVRKLIYASSSSVYGNNQKIPFSELDKVKEPISVYAASKITNELLAYTYSHLYGIQTIGLRFFTVYGPWGRPDMAIYLFSKDIMEDKPIKVFNYGNLSRDFTYIDDIIQGLMQILKKDLPEKAYRIYNIGNSKPVSLMDFIAAVEQAVGKKAKKEMLPMQKGDVSTTWADTTKLQKDFDYKPQTDLQEGVNSFIEWLKEYSEK
ncbi:MAG TPA: GDP-mannose 4,6-dehydratase [Flavobacteriaceae bacterium]|nr:GDP-mannose 4,6-dehydratase [Flavobacteriaceae bacterium]